MRKTFSLIALFSLLLLVAVGCRSKNLAVSTAQPQRSIVVIFDNDIHCQIDKYPVLAGYRDAVADTAMTAVVSCGDFVQGATPGAISKGQYCIDIMKKVGYDAVTLGNHEFDYNMPRLFELASQLGDSVVVSANLVDYKTRANIFPPYRIKDFGGRKVAFLGLTTPGTLETEAYAFVDRQSNQIYDLMDSDFFGMAQRHIDAARAEGADYVVVISHLGEDPIPLNVNSPIFIANTTGIDALLDGHTHNVVGPMTLPDKSGKPVVVAQTGSHLANIGKLLISPEGKLSIELVPTEGMAWKNMAVQNAVDSVENEMQAIVDRVVCHSDFDLRVTDGKGDDVGRRRECNAGDLVCDAFRVMAGADVAVSNTGGIRNDILKGDITYGDVVNMLPYDNKLCLVELPGSMIVEMLRANIQSLPENDGQFPQVSGLKFTAVVPDRTVRDVMVLNAESGVYEPLDPDKTYKLASTDYCVYNGGLRNTLKNSKLVQDGIILYSDALIEYLADRLGGKIPSEYAAPQGRITVVGMPE